MKRLYTALILLTITATTQAQQVEVYLPGQTTDISGTVHAINVSSDDMVVQHLMVKNVSGAELSTVRVTRKRISVSPDWEDGLCWGPSPDPNFQGGCYSAAQMQTNPWLSPSPGSTLVVDGFGELIVDIKPTLAGGAGLYRYYFRNGGTMLDSIDVQVNSSLGIGDQEDEPVFGMTAYPNPASSYVTVNTVGASGSYDIRITDVLGKVVYYEDAGPSKKIDVSNFKNGVYLITAIEKGQAIQTRRVVVKH